MGYERHNAFVVSGSYEDYVDKAHEFAAKIGMRRMTASCALAFIGSSRYSWFPTRVCIQGCPMTASELMIANDPELRRLRWWCSLMREATLWLFLLSIVSQLAAVAVDAQKKKKLEPCTERVIEIPDVPRPL